jgi:NurA-like 5'-3' nuclease
MDADLLFGALHEGQRGPLFASMSTINVKEYRRRHHMVHFFYMRVGRELARVELPQWVQPDQIDLVHSLVYDQCARGQGYPVALSRAHEQAVVRTADRRTFQRMVESSLQRAELPVAASRKSESKERQAV